LRKRSRYDDSKAAGFIPSAAVAYGKDGLQKVELLYQAVVRKGSCKTLVSVGAASRAPDAA
jgi:hypothetical protein